MKPATINKTAQITLIFLLSVILIMIGIYVATVILRSGDGVQQAAEPAELSQARDSVRYLLSTCLESTTQSAMAQYGLKPGLSEGLIKSHIIKYMPICTEGFSRFESQGFNIIEGKINPLVTISGDGLILSITLNYPLSLEREGTSISIGTETYIYNTMSMKPLSDEEDTIILSQHHEVQLVIPAGTTATLDGNPLTQVGIQIVDREFDGHTNAVLAGMLAFKGIPSGAVFSKPITIAMHYNDFDVPTTINELDLKLAFYSEELGVWVSIPTTVDAENNMLTAYTYHFTAFGIVLRCSDVKDLTDTITPLLVQEDCRGCSGWSSSGAPSGVGPLWIQSDQIGQGYGLGTVPSCEHKTVTETVFDCADCSGECMELPVPDEYECSEEYYYYNEVQFEGTNTDGYIRYASNGDSCIWAEEGAVDPKPRIAIKDTANPNPGNNWDVLLDAKCLDPADECLLSDVSFSDNTISYKLRVINGNAPNSCIKSRVLVYHNGFGILKDEKQSYYVCDSEGAEAQVPVIGGKIDEVIDSVCIKNEYEDLVWTAKPGAVVVRDPGLGPVAQRLRTSGGAQCREGDSTPQEYPPCPDDYETNYHGKSFRVSECIDTRDRDFCDWYGDFPHMQYTKDMRFSADTELVVFGSALRNGQCWLMVEAQQEVVNHNPDFYVKLEQVQENILSNTYTEFDGVCAVDYSDTGTTPSGTPIIGGGNIPSATMCGSTNAARGIDVSHWDADYYMPYIDWGSVAGSGIEFAFIKASEGIGYEDTKFDHNWKEAKAAGVLRGAYHFMRPTDGVAQADTFLKALDGDYGELLPVADLEDSQVPPEVLKAFINTVEAKTGRKVMIYTSPGFWWGYEDMGFGNNPLWIAHWGVSCPSVPDTWSEWAFWQDCGDCPNEVPGVGGNLMDYNYFNGDSAALHKYSAQITS